MRKQFYSISLLFGSLLLGLSSCSKEQGISQAPESQGRITFSIGIPKGDPVTYATIHDSEEWGIESLWLYEFDKDGTTLLEAPVDIKSSLQGSGPEYTYTKQLADANTGLRRFVFVANESVPSGIVKGSSLSALQAKLAGKQLSSNGTSADLLNDFSGSKRIPMTGEATQGSNNVVIAVTGNSKVNVFMTRIVARIDVSNNIPNFEITDLKLVKTNNVSYLLPRVNATGNVEIPSGVQKVNGIGTFAALSATVPTGGSFVKGETLKKAFYLYEGDQPSKSEAVHVQVKGLLGGHEVFYNIPFWQGSKGVTVKRNHIYYLTLGDGKVITEPGSEISFTIEDTPWNHLLLNETFEPIESSYTGSASGVSYNSAKQELTVDSNAHSNAINFEFTTKFTDHSSFTASPSASWLTASFSANQLTINTQVNSGSSERVGTVTVTSNADSTTKYVITVKQGHN